MKELTLTARVEKDLDAISSKILEAFPGERIFALEGELGAGKTALIKAFCRALGVDQAVLSPTFALINEYSDAEEEPVYHFDFYRIKKLEEVMDIGYEEYLYSGYYCFLEWADMIKELLPQEHVYITIEKQEQGQTRQIMITKE